MGRKYHRPDCSCKRCSGPIIPKREREGRNRWGEGRGGWEPSGSQPPDVGIVAGTDHVVSFKTGRKGTDNEEHTLIADGDYSDDAEGFRKAHNHYGRRRERDRPGYFSDDRGYYTGPDH
jgi:hypothetical protein